jgi:hypothetical protein
MAGVTARGNQPGFDGARMALVKGGGKLAKEGYHACIVREVVGRMWQASESEGLWLDEDGGFPEREREGRGATAFARNFREVWRGRPWRWERRREGRYEYYVCCWRRVDVVRFGTSNVSLSGY